MTISYERMRELLIYEPETGIFRHKIGRKGRGTAAGAVAGRVRPHDGRCRIGLDGKRYFANQLAWFYMTSEWPASDVDHINGVQNDDRFENLRIATRTQNLANAKRPKHNTSGFKGASWHKSADRWRASIKNSGAQIHIGYFDTAEEAHAAYCTKAKSLFGNFARAV